MKRRTALGVLLALPFLSRQLWAGEVPPDRQGTLILRTLAYDRNLKGRVGTLVNVLILYRAGNQPSESMKADMVGAFEELAKAVTVLDRPVKIASAMYDNAAHFEEKCRSTTLVYVCAGLDDRIAAISEITRRHSVLTFAGIEAYLHAGLAVGVLARGSKPAIVLNLGASQAEGAEWDPLFLRVAEVMR